MKRTRPNITGTAKNLRKNLTDTEKLLWKHLRARQIEGIKFRRQEPIGKLIVDFVSLENRNNGRYLLAKFFQKVFK